MSFKYLRHSAERQFKKRYPKGDIRSGFGKPFAVKDQIVNGFGFEGYTGFVTMNIMMQHYHCTVKAATTVYKQMVWPCAHKTLFTKLGGFHDSSHGPKFAGHCPP